MGKKSSGHTMGKIPGNMISTGHHPKGGNPSEVSISELTKANGHNPGAKAMEGASLGKLASSTPYPMPSTDSWSGASAGKGGKKG